MTGLITWACILLSYIRFYHACKVQGIDRNTFPYKAPLQPYASYIGLTVSTRCEFVLLCFSLMPTSCSSFPS